MGIGKGVGKADGCALIVGRLDGTAVGRRVNVSVAIVLVSTVTAIERDDSTLSSKSDDDNSLCTSETNSSVDDVVL